VAPLRELLKSDDIETRQRARDALDRLTQRLAPFYVVSATRPADKDQALELADRTTRVFLGAGSSCAKCHDQPFNRWSVDDGYRLSAFFTDVRTGRLENGGYEVQDLPGRRPLIRPDTGKEVMAVWPGSRATPGAGETSRAAFARFVTEKKESRQFSRAIVNRVWAHLFGRGLVDPPDELGERSGPPLLNALAADFASHGFDMRWLIREIANSEAYRGTPRKPLAPKPARGACPSGK
jgi:hypothetical protein